MKKTIMAIFSFLPLFYTGCTSYYLKAHCDLKQIEKVYKGTLNKTFSVPLFNNFDFSDSIISVKLELLNYGASIRIKNNLFKSVQVDWDKSSYIDPDGQAHKIVHTSVDELERVQEPRTIPAYSFVNDTIINWDAVDWDESEEEKFEDWVVKPLFDTTCKDQNFIDPYIAKYKGKQFKLILSVVSDSEPIEYIFTFELSYFDKAKYNRSKGEYVTF